MVPRPAPKTAKRRRDSSDVEVPDTSAKKAKKAARKGFEESKTTLEQAEPYRILTAKMPVKALVADWSLGRNRVIQEEHVKALCKLFQRGDMKRASYPLAVLGTRSAVECMLRQMGYGGDMTDVDNMPAFDDWLLVNGRPVELLDGQHRIEALKRYVSETGAGEEELSIGIANALPPELNLALRMNRRDPTMGDSHGDIWVQLVAAASKDPNIFHGNVAEMEAQMLRALHLGGEASFPLRRLVTIWRNERWRQMTTRRCETTVGRATFQISTWDWMICHRTDDFWFMAFRRVLGTLAQLPGDAARLVSSADWKLMSASLVAERTREQVQALFYPGHPGEPVSVAGERNPKLLRAFDDRGYRDVYERVLRTPALRFPDIHRITGLSQGQGRVLSRVLDHVVRWPNLKRTIVANRRDNNKPPLRQDLEPALDYFGPTRLREAEKRLKVFFPPATPPRSSRESASVLLQQEVLEYVLEHLAAFQAHKARAYLDVVDGDPDNDLYAVRFREETWGGVLKIVRWYVGGDFRREWLPVEGSGGEPPGSEPSTQAASLTDAFCNYAAGLPMVFEDEKLRHRLQTSAFRTALAMWLSEQCDDAEPDGQGTRSDDGARGSRGSHAKDDESAVVVAAAAEAAQQRKSKATGPCRAICRRRRERRIGKNLRPQRHGVKPVRDSGQESWLDRTSTGADKPVQQAKESSLASLRAR
ncbi:hypothetical protein HIM_09609 [Hirsutella minnesotensis 3608]|uniref:DGQHR domain-containing protein n=1 Tax=Hirsutella minnesotensis 3608 TaxID=1043627 RepID=A0A0F7ZSA0_9HYPO|nr:hypothetical protein HIM_09609 [Hirsutella minnesotensis 3608]